MPDSAEIPHHVERETETELRFASNAIVLLGGLPGSGKSHVIEKLAVPDSVVVSADAYRLAYTDDITNHLIEEDIWFSTARKAGVRARVGQPSLVDMTSLMPKFRRRFTAITYDTGAPVSLVMLEVDPQVCLGRQEARGRVIPPAVFDFFCGEYQRTLTAIRDGTILDEGFADARTLNASEIDRLRAISFDSQIPGAE